MKARDEPPNSCSKPQSCFMWDATHCDELGENGRLSHTHTKKKKMPGDEEWNLFGPGNSAKGSQVQQHIMNP